MTKLVNGLIRFIGSVQEVKAGISKIKVFPEFCVGLERLDDFSHIIILYWFHLRDDSKHRKTIRVVPRKHPGAPQVGVFASRSPSRPTPIGLCVSEILKIEDCFLTVSGLDAVKDSPILDIKPYLPRTDSISEAFTPKWSRQGPKT